MWSRLKEEPGNGKNPESAKARGFDMRFHGAVELRGINCPRSRYYEQGRFGRMFPLLAPLHAPVEALRELGAKGGPMDGGPSGGPDNPAGTPAGFTFLGQFIDHDMTFDPTSSLERQADPEAISNFRTPSLELDSVYGAGPGASPHLYQRRDRRKLLVGLDWDEQPSDLPRNQEQIAIIGDPRNDENLIVSQLHLALIKFHNAVVDLVDQHPPPGRSVFDEAQRLVRWHYQWIVVHEFLPRIVGEKTVEKVFGVRIGVPGRSGSTRREFYKWRNEPYIPVEFSVAAYRFGHSQVRPGYAINQGFGRPIFAPRDPSAPPPGDGRPPQPPTDLSGGRRILPEQKIEWHRFFKLPASGQELQKGKAIDLKLSGPLFDLPFTTGNPEDPSSLAERNLRRHLTFGLPSGQAVAASMGRRPLIFSDDAVLKAHGLEAHTPLWYYILKEAEADDENSGATLGPVGGRIVAEVFCGLLEGDGLSYFAADPGWAPDPRLAGQDGHFTMADLLRVAGVA